MTRFQARYIQWLTLIGCSLRATAGHYYSRYNREGVLIGGTYNGAGGNQIDGILLRKEAIEHLLEAGIDPMFSWEGNNIGYGQDDYENWRRTSKVSR